MVYTKEEFKKLWEADEHGSGITFDDIADCAKAWGLFTMPKCIPTHLVTYNVLCTAGCSDAEEWK